MAGSKNKKHPSRNPPGTMFSQVPPPCLDGLGQPLQNTAATPMNSSAAPRPLSQASHQEANPGAQTGLATPNAPPQAFMNQAPPTFGPVSAHPQENMAGEVLDQSSERDVAATFPAGRDKLAITPTMRAFASLGVPGTAAFMTANQMATTPMAATSTSPETVHATQDSTLSLYHRNRTHDESFDQASVEFSAATRVRLDDLAAQTILAGQIPSTSAATSQNSLASPNGQVLASIAVASDDANLASTNQASALHTMKSPRPDPASVSSSISQSPRYSTGSLVFRDWNEWPTLQAETTASGGTPSGTENNTPSGADNKKRKAIEIEECKECCVCYEEFFTSEVLTAPCGHHYCRVCNREHFQTSFSNRMVFPPHCCGKTIEIEEARRFIGPDLAARYMEKKLEFETPNPVFCAAPECSKFIPPANHLKGFGICQACGRATHKRCRKAAHPGQECPADQSEEEVRELAEKHKWKRCYECSTHVDRIDGCNHITCICKAQWCYACLAKWPATGIQCSTPGCELYPAGPPVNATQIARPPPDAHTQRRRATGLGAQSAMERNAIAHARAHEKAALHPSCTHAAGWEKNFGADDCFYCETTLGEFLWQCPLCEHKACNRCKRDVLGGGGKKVVHPKGQTRDQQGELMEKAISKGKL